MNEPTLISDLVKFIGRFSSDFERELWKRFRITMTLQELAEYRKWFKESYPERDFIQALRGFPIIIDPAPTNPYFYLEPTDDKRD